MANIHFYGGTVTSGGTDGVLLSESDGSSPFIIGPLDAPSGQESEPKAIAIRCDAGYKTNGSASIQLVGSNNIKWALALDNNGVPGTFNANGASLTVPSEITAVNTIIWVKAKATSDEAPGADTTVRLQVVCILTAA